MERITVAFLKRHDACASQVRKFAKTFPRGTPINLRSLEKAEKAGIEWRWLAAFGDAEYWKAIALINAEHRKALASINDEGDYCWTEYRKALDLINAEYWKALASILIPALLRYKEE